MRDEVLLWWNQAEAALAAARNAFDDGKYYAVTLHARLACENAIKAKYTESQGMAALARSDLIVLAMAIGLPDHLQHSLKALQPGAAAQESSPYSKAEQQIEIAAQITAWISGRLQVLY